jgi:starch synthase
MFAAEISPFIKVGGLGDVVGALPKALEKLGAKPVVVVPAYKAVHQSKFDIRPCETVPGFNVPMGSHVERADIFQARLEDTGIDVYLIGSKKYFDRKGVYDDPATKEGYRDNGERFVFFMKSGLELLLKLGMRADIIHCHDSHAALIPGIIRTNYRDDPFFANAGTVFTIHNLAYQGLYSKRTLYYAGIDSRHFYPMSPFEYWNKVNFMKAGILLADKVNTVSQTYAVEIRKSHEHGLGLEGVLLSRKGDVSGIVNGIDYEEWNPQTDPLIPAHFSVRDLSGKLKCKEHLREHFGLPQSRGRVPLIGIVSRLADQKGFDLIAGAIREIAALNLQLVVLGTGQRKYHELFHRITSQYPDKIAVHLSFDNELAHRIEAGSDIFLMPSKYEPCGLSQLYSLRYGTIPVVRSTGGLADTVANYDRDKGTGFAFAGYTSAEMMTALKKALTVYADRDAWQALMIRAMSEDWSWDRSAEKYMQLYRNIYQKRNP